MSADNHLLTFTVASDPLTDGSRVYAVHGVARGGEVVVFECTDARRANDIYDALQAGCIDMLVRGAA